MNDPKESPDNELMVSNTEITVLPENRREFFQTVSSVSSRIRREKGCVSFRVYEETGNENSMILVGVWGNKEDWYRHCTGENFAVLHGTVQVLSIKSKIGHKLLGVLED